MKPEPREGWGRAAVSGALAALAGLALLSLVDCTSLRVYTAKSPSASFDTYRTYAHDTSEIPPAGFSRTPLTRTVLAKVQVSIDRELATKGYTIAAFGTAPDLVVRSAAGRRERERAVGSKVAEDVDWIAPDVASVYSEATLTIDVFDARSRDLVWHGSSRRRLGTSPAVREDSVAEAVNAILRTFPAAAIAAAPKPIPAGPDRL